MSTSDDSKNTSTTPTNPEKSLQIDQNLLFSALTGLELILRDGKNSAIKLLEKPNTLEMLLSSFNQIFIKNNQNNEEEKFDLEIRQQVCKILGCFSILYDTNLLNLKLVEQILEILKLAINDRKRKVRREAGKGNSEWLLTLGENVNLF